MESSTITPENVEHVVKSLMQRVPAVELAMAPRGPAGLDGLLTAPDLLQELRCVAGADSAGAGPTDAANEVWLKLFVHRTPLSDPCRRVLTLFNKLGFRDHVQTRNLPAIRDAVAALKEGEWEEHVRQLAQLQHAVLAVDAAADPAAGVPLPAAAPYALVAESVQAETAKLLLAHARRHGRPPHHVRLHVAPGAPAPQMREIMDAARALQCPLWLVAETVAALPVPADLHGIPHWVSCPHQALPALCHAYPHATPINVSSKSSDIYEFVRKGLELRGSHFVGYASLQLGTLEHVAAGWCHARAAVARVLAERYRCLLYAGWNLSSSEIVEDAAQLSGCCVMPGTEAPAAPPQTQPPPTPGDA